MIRDPKPDITIAIPTWNRVDMVKRAIKDVVKDPRIVEIVICDDASGKPIWEDLVKWADTVEKVRLLRNCDNLDCYSNKAQTLRHVKTDFAILLDSDNKIGPEYIDALYRLEYFDPDFSVLPVFARPHFDYREFAGQVIARDNVSRFMRNPTFRCALNTANYFIHVRSYLAAWDPSVNPHTADSIFMNCQLLDAGKKLLFLDGLEYDHEVHDGSHYKQNHKKTGTFAAEVEAKLRAMR